MTRLRGSKKRDMNGRPATTYQVKDRGKRLKQNFLQMEIFYHATYPANVALDNLVVWVRRKHTLYKVVSIWYEQSDVVVGFGA
jgi:hypothetical protein